MKKTELKVWITKDALQKNKLNHGDMYDYSNISLLVLDDKFSRVVKSIQGREVVKATLIVEEELAELEKLKNQNDIMREALIFYADLDDEAVGYDIRGVTYAREILKKIGILQND